MTENRVLFWTFLLSLLLHVAVVALSWNWNFFSDPAELGDDEVESVELFLVPDDDILDFDAPNSYTAVPERHTVADPPAQPDFLALRKSKAADTKKGGKENSSPGADEKAPFSQIKIREHQESPASGAVAVVEEESSKQQDTELKGNKDSSLEGSFAEGDPEAEGKSFEEKPVPDLASLFKNSVTSIMKEQQSGQSGDVGFDYDQNATSASDGNAVQFGEFSLNTIDWAYAPWMEKFRRDFMPNWTPPYAYALGVIDGVTKLKLVVEHDGSIGELKILSMKGHESLHQASEAALWATAPFARLPSDFPEENLVIILSLHYPAWKQEQAENLQQTR